MSIAKAPKALLNLQKTTVPAADADIMGQNIVGQFTPAASARVTSCAARILKS